MAERKKAIAEDAEAFTLDDGSRVAKAALSPSGLERLRADASAAPQPPMPPGMTTGEKVSDVASNVGQTLVGMGDTINRILPDDQPAAIKYGLAPLRVVNELAAPGVMPAIASGTGNVVGNAVRSVQGTLHDAAPNVIGAPVPQAEIDARKAAANAPSPGASEPTVRLTPQPVPGAPGPSPGPLGALQAATTGGVPAGPGMPGSTGAMRQALQAVDDAQALGLRAAQAHTAVQIAQTQAEQAVYPAKLQALAANQQITAKAAADYQAARNQQMQMLTQQVNDFANSKVDVNHYWGTQTTPQKALAGISMLLGVFGGGSRNQGAAAIDKAINDDIAAQQAAVEHQGQAIGQRRNLLGMMKDAWGDDVAAQAAAKLAMIERYDVQLQDIASRFKTPALQAGLMQAHATLQQKKADQLQVLMPKMEEFANDRAKVGVSAYEAQSGRMNAETQRMVAGAKSNGKDPETFVPGVGYAANKEFAKDAANAVTAYKDVDGLINGLRALRVKYGPEVLNRDAVARGRTMAARLKVAMLKAGHLGTLDKGSEELLDKMIGGDPSQFGTYLSSLDTLGEFNKQGLRNVLAPRMLGDGQQASPQVDFQR